VPKNVPHALTLILALVPAGAFAQGRPDDPASEVARLIAAFAGDTPLAADLESLTDEVGGRATGSPANLRSVDWALARFQAAGVPAHKEEFTMPGLWLERAATAVVAGEGVRFTPRVAAMPFSTPTAAGGLTAPLLDAGSGSEADLQRLGDKAKGAFLLVETQELKDVDGLFREYEEAAEIEPRAFAAGAAGVVYMGSRPNDLLYRHNAAAGFKNDHPMLVMERDGAARALRLLRAGKALTLTETIDVQSGPAYSSYNVIGEIAGSTHPEEVVIAGAHLDSWDLGTGALDNGANVVLLIDVARQMRRLAIRPARTVRFILWNGEEQGMFGSWGYTKAHEAELDRHAAVAIFDIGCGRINGFFTNGRGELLPAVERALAPVAGLGPFTQINEPLVGTDNFDFMLHGVANLVANQEPASYGPNYHARSDEFDKCDIHQLRANAAVVAALVYGLAQGEASWGRQSRAEIEKLVRSTSLEKQMKTFALWDDWAARQRGRR
jgi:carboxypeptidase Q